MVRYTLLSTPTCPFLPMLLTDLWCRHLSCPTTAWQTEEENPCLYTTLLSSQRVKCRHVRPLSAWPMETYVMRSFMKGIPEECLQTCWELWGAKKPPCNMVPPQSNIWVDLWHVLPETWTEPEELMQEEETCNLPETSKDGWRHSTPRPPELVEIPRCNNAGIEWNEKMPAGQPL